MLYAAIYRAIILCVFLLSVQNNFAHTHGYKNKPKKTQTNKKKQTNKGAVS